MNITHEYYFGYIPEKFKSEFVELYESAFCTIEYNQAFCGENTLNCFSIHDENKLLHIIIFTINQPERNVTVLNRVCEINSKYLNLFSDSVFVTISGIDTIQFCQLTNQVSEKQKFPYICAYFNDDNIIKLPATSAEYFSSLSYHMRNHTQSYIGRLKRAFGDYTFELFEKKEIPESVIDKILEMSHLRMRQKNIDWGYDDTYIHSLKKFLLDFGYVSVLKINGEIVAGLIMYSIKNHFFFETTSSNLDYDKNNVGHTCFFLSIQSCIDRNGKEIHLLWGNSPYKKRFLAEEHPLYSITFYRTRFIKLKFKVINEYLPNFSIKKLHKLFKRKIKNILGGENIGNILQFRIKTQK